jgi:hypothetical protein
MKNNNLLIFLGIGGALVGYYFWNKNRQKQLTQQVQPVAEEEDAKGEIVPVGSGGGGGGGFSAPVTPTPTIVVATNPTSTPVSTPVITPTATMPTPASAPAPATSVAPAPSLPPKTPPAPAPIISKPSISLAKPVTMTTPKSPFSGMDGRNAYDLDLVNDL